MTASNFPCGPAGAFSPFPWQALVNFVSSPRFDACFSLPPFFVGRGRSCQPVTSEEDLAWVSCECGMSWRMQRAEYNEHVVLCLCGKEMQEKDEQNTNQD